jgi:GNAT superfamily N-acetyltransferase
MNEAAPAALAFESFHGDFAAVAALIGRSWAENAGQSLNYSPEFLESCFAYPGMMPELAPALYAGSPQAFVAGFPRRVRLFGEDRRLVLLTFFTVAPELKGKGIGVRLWAEALRRARSAGFDGALYYCVQGNRSNEVTAAGVRAAGFQPVCIGEVPHRMRALRRATPVDAAMDNAPAILMELARELSPNVLIARQWTPAEAEWQCFGRENSVCVTEGADAVLSGYVMEIADKSRTRCLLIEDLLWSRLPEDQRLPLLLKLLEQGAGKGAQIAIAPQLGYAAMEPLQAAGFRRSPKSLNAYAALWREPLAAFQGESSIYMDVL